MSPRAPHRLLRLVALVLATVAFVLATPASRAEAWMPPDWTQINWRRTYGACPIVAGQWNPAAQVLMREFGSSGVQRFEVVFGLYEVEGGSSLYTAQFRSPAYRSTVFSNDRRNFSIRLPNGDSHRWTGILYPVQIEAKMKWDRVFYKPDWKAQRTIVICQEG